MSGTIVVYLETADGRLEPASREALGVARSLAGRGGRVLGVAVTATAGLEAELASSGADEVRLLRVGDASPAVIAEALRTAATAGSAATVVLAGTVDGRDVAGRLAVRWDAGAATGVTEVSEEPEGIRVGRPVFGGRATQSLRLTGPRRVVALRPHSFPPAAPSPAPAPVTELPAPDLPASLRATGRQSFTATQATAGPDLGSASIVVAGGRGLGSADGFALVERLAVALGAAVGASRAVTDAGWRPASMQVGQTGRSVSPQLYLAIVISGAIQHVVGMVSSRVIVAINSDAQAPIFRVADYGVVGDVKLLVPALTAEVRRVRGLP